jgi:hypothetical protein
MKSANIYHRFPEISFTWFKPEFLHWHLNFAWNNLVVLL